MTSKTPDKTAGNDRLLKLVNIHESSGNPPVDTSQADYQFAADEIGPGKQVVMHFSLALPERAEAVIDSNFGRAPAAFSIGDGNLLPGFERLLYGLKAGQEKSFTVPAKDAFGERNEDNIQRYPRYQFPADLVMQTGLMINFSDAAGNEQAGIVHSVQADEVEIDFNHPLAGREIRFTVAIAEVRPELG